MWICSDSLPYYKNTGFRTWFYFAVRGVERGRFIHFHVKNLNFQRSLYAAGLKPFFRYGNEGKFKRIPGKITWNVSTSHWANLLQNGNEGLQIAFEFQQNFKDNGELIYFSFVEPWGYDDTVNYFSKYQNQIKSDPEMASKIYFHRELLGYSKENRFVELITITGQNCRTDDRDEDIEGPVVFPKFSPESPESEFFETKRSLRFEKPVVFLSARVHPGEVQSSHVLNGIVDLLMSDTE